MSDPAAPAGEVKQIIVTAVQGRRPSKYIVTARDGERELHRDELDPNQAARRDKFVRRTLEAAYPGANPKDWSREVRCDVEEQLARLARVPPGDPAAVPPAPPGAAAPEVTDGGYTETDGHTYYLGGDRRTKLANFVARIVSETLLDDGAEQHRELAVAVTMGGEVATVAVPTERFAAMDWVATCLGPRHVIQAGQGVKDRLRCAIQEISGTDIPTSTVYRHTGWREVGDRWHYLHAGGADGVSARLDGALSRFVLPDPPTGDELRDAVRASLGILNGLAPTASRSRSWPRRTAPRSAARWTTRCGSRAEPARTRANSPHSPSGTSGRTCRATGCRATGHRPRTRSRRWRSPRRTRSW